MVNGKMLTHLISLVEHVVTNESVLLVLNSKRYTSELCCLLVRQLLCATARQKRSNLLYVK
jgi:hypothetical protein